MTFSDRFFHTWYPDDRLTRMLLERAAKARAERAQQRNCAECGLDGHHDIWCPHWQPYVADES